MNTIEQALRETLMIAEVLNKRPRPLCRDCADNDGVCPTTGMPCNVHGVLAEARAALSALESKPVSEREALPELITKAIRDLRSAAYGAGINYHTPGYARDAQTLAESLEAKIADALRHAALGASEAAPAFTGYCAEGDRCVCGGDLPRVRAGCSNWRVRSLAAAPSGEQEPGA